MPERDTAKKPNRIVELLAGEYGMLAVLILLALLFTVLTLGRQTPEGTSGGNKLARQILSESDVPPSVFIAARDTAIDHDFADALERRLRNEGASIVDRVHGAPSAIRERLDLVESKFDVIAVSPPLLSMPVFTRFVGEGKIGGRLQAPAEYTGSTFLSSDNLRNIASQIAVIAILAIGMTMVIITAGIDLSVGSLIALSAVTSTFLIQRMGGADGAGTGALATASLAGIAACALVGAFTGWMVAGFCVPPFIATLAMMQVVRGSAFKIADNQTISDVPASFQWLGNGLTLGIPNCVILMAALYVLAHIIMSKTRLGRYIYATGGNPEAARLSGISPKRIKLIVYIIAGALAGLGGIVLASQLQSGAGRYGDSYELKVIAAVVVGGTSLFGGRGKIFGTLIGAFIIAVIENGMNLKKLGSETQMIVLGAVILIAVLLERLRSGEWRSATGG
ncbi:MAG: ABC transporter permease [Verrucomicrobiales bacterium]